MQGEITRLLNDANNPEALNQVIDLVYLDLRRIAANYLKGTPNRTMQPTDLVHEAYGEFAKKAVFQFNDRAHFFGCASLIMRHLLYKYARDMKRLKRGGDHAKVSLDEGMVGGQAMDAEELLHLQNAMNKLQQLDPDKHRLVELRSYLGLSMKEIATVTDTALRTVERDWKFCRVWLSRELKRTA